MSRCTECNKEAGGLVEGICASCRETLGLLPFELPVQRRPGPCRRCGNPEIIQALVRERGGGGGDYVHGFVRPLALSHGLVDRLSIWSKKKKGVAVDLESFSGALVAYVCRGCGATELYTLSPEEIPIGPRHGTRLLKAEDKPYR